MINDTKNTDIQIIYKCLIEIVQYVEDKIF